jgi:hypothetical protein
MGTDSRFNKNPLKWSPGPGAYLQESSMIKPTFSKRAMFETF